jgi:hypothetical protein
MKRHLFTVSILIYAATFCSFSQVYFKENLSRYTAGNNLENVSQANGWTTNLGDWTVSGKNDGANTSSLSPVIATETMSYLNFATSNKVIVCDPTVMGTTTSYRQTILRFSKDAISLTEPNNLVYYSSMLNLSGSADGDTGPLMGLIKQGTFDVDPGYALPSSSYSTTWRARVWAKVTGTQVQFGISKSGTPTVWSTTSYNLSDTHLLLVKYVNKSVSSSNAADEFYLLIDPVVTESEPAASAYMAAEGNSSGGGADLRMAAIVSQKLKMKIGQIRLTGTYNEAITPDGTYTSTGINNIHQQNGINVLNSHNQIQLSVIESGLLTISDVNGKELTKKHMQENDKCNHSYQKDRSKKCK